jgi:hypothetical protein
MQVKGFILLRWNTNVNFSFFDRSLVDQVNSDDPAYIRQCIRDRMKGTSVTVVLIGEMTHKSSWVEWEIEESEERGNGLLGIKLKGREAAMVPNGLRARSARVIYWSPNDFEREIEGAAIAAGH